MAYTTCDRCKGKLEKERNHSPGRHGHICLKCQREDRMRKDKLRIDNKARNKAVI